MAYTTDKRPCGCSRRPGAPKCNQCAPIQARTGDSKPAMHIHVSKIIRMVRERIATGKR
jgi:hypothetical protein